jgi:ferritin
MVPQKLAQAINEQIKNEMESAYLYLSAAAYFHSVSLDGMAHWMRCQAHEETIHAMKFMDHLIDRNAPVALLDMVQHKTQWAKPLEVWRDAYAHEQFITSKINDLTTIAREVKDYQSEPILAWFTAEQIEEEATSAKIVGEMEMVEGSKSALLMLDREMGVRVFPPGSPFDPVAYAQGT